MEFISSLSSTSAEIVPKEGLTPVNLKYLERVFQEVAGDHEEICADQFKKIVKSNNKFFVRRIFKLFDVDRSGSVSLQEFMTGMTAFAQLTSTQKLHWLFRIYDIDEDGLIQFCELKNVIKACMKENGLHFTDSEVDELTTMLFEDADTDITDGINFEKFQNQLKRQPGLSENITISLEYWLSPRNYSEQYLDVKKLVPRKLKWDYLRNNAVTVSFFIMFLAVNIGLFAGAAYKYRKENPFVIVARGCGQCLNFTSAFVLVLVFRRGITWMRNHGFSSFLPLDQHIYYHKLTGWFIFIYSITHTVMHIINFALVSKKTGIPLLHFLFYTYLEIGWVGGAACLTGWILLVALIIMVVAALPFVRRSGRFEVFYYTHLLFIVYFAVLILHGPNFWKWFIAPAALYLIELCAKFYWKFVTNRKAYIYKGILLPSNVIELVIKRPPNFAFNPGDYVFVNMPEIAKYEWHPFTLSSAPEVEDVICLHIRGIGGWTKELVKYFKRQEEDAIPISSPTDGNYGAISETSHVNLAFQEEQEEKREAVELRDKSKHSQKLDEKPETSKSPLNKRHHTFPKHKRRNHRQRNSVRISTARKSLRQGGSIIIMPIVEESAGDDVNAMESGNLVVPKRDESSNDNVILSECPLKISIDGPYGSPSSHLFQAEHAVMIATGIGVTPFASVLQSIMHRHRSTMHCCPQCDHSFRDAASTTLSGMKLKKVDFFWINRDQSCFEWFVSLLSQLEIDDVRIHNDGERFLDIHMYVTSAIKKTDIKALGLQMALDLLHSKEERCLVTGLKTRTQPGRPDWNNVFQDIASRRKGRVTVFFCGPHSLAKEIHTKCNEFKFNFRKEIF